jgi:hypothetical protein
MPLKKHHSEYRVAVMFSVRDSMVEDVLCGIGEYEVEPMEGYYAHDIAEGRACHAHYLLIASTKSSRSIEKTDIRFMPALAARTPEAPPASEAEGSGASVDKGAPDGPSLLGGHAGDESDGR